MGKAIMHINGTKYRLAGEYADKDGRPFQDLDARIERLVKGTETQVQYFEVLIDGHKGRLIVRPSDELVSAAVVYVPEE